MFADAGPFGNDPDVYQIKFPEASQLCVPRDGDVERAAKLDGPVHVAWGRGFVGGIHRIGQVVGPCDLGAEELEQGFRLSVNPPGELDLFHHLVGAVVELLFGGDNAEQVDDEGKQQDSNKNEDYCAEMAGFSPFAFQEP